VRRSASAVAAAALDAQAGAASALPARIRAADARPSKPKKRGMPEAWWDPWEERTAPDEASLVALREFWGATGGRMKTWASEEGWKPPPPRRDGKEDTSKTVAALCGPNLEYKPKTGVVWRKGFVCKLELPDHGLAGPLPAAPLATLGKCRVVCLRGNALAGPLPGAALLALVCLEDLDGAGRAEAAAAAAARAERLRRAAARGPRQFEGAGGALRLREPAVGAPARRARRLRQAQEAGPARERAAVRSSAWRASTRVEEGLDWSVS